MVTQPYVPRRGAIVGYQWMMNPAPSNYNSIPSMTAPHTYLNSTQITHQEVEKLREGMQQMKNLQQQM